MSRHFEQADGLCETPDDATRDFLFNQTMLRIKDPAVSLDFYTRVLGMRLVRKLDFPAMKFSLYFLAYLGEEEARQVPEDDAKRLTYTFGREAMLELTHNWGSEEDPELSYHDGNAEPQGFGHICFSVPELDAAIAWFDANDVKYVKRPEQGKMKDVAFIKDPDGYWIEIVEAARMKEVGRKT